MRIILGKICSICKDYKFISEFYKHNTNKDGLFPYCKKCNIEKVSNWQQKNKKQKYEYNKKRREENPEYFKKHRRKHYENNKDRMAKEQKSWRRENKDKVREYGLKREQNKTHNISKEEWEKCKVYFNHSCAYCGLSEEDHKMTYGQQLHRDHVVHDGANDLSNCVPACKPCNSSKHTFGINDWYNDNNNNYTTYRMSKINDWLITYWKHHMDIVE